LWQENATALRAFFVLNGFSLVLAATDLLLVLMFLLPGASTIRRGQQQVRPRRGYE
jgi:hypothetical protein